MPCFDLTESMSASVIVVLSTHSTSAMLKILFNLKLLHMMLRVMAMVSLIRGKSNAKLMREHLELIYHVANSSFLSCFLD